MKKLLLSTAIAASMAGNAVAQDFQFEIDAFYVTGERELPFFGDTDFDGYGFEGRIHFDVVDTGQGPLAEAAFLDQSSFVGATWISAEADAPGADSESTVILDGRFVTQTDWIFEGTYTDIEDDDSTITLGVGKYLTQNTDFVVSLGQIDPDDDDDDATSIGVDSHTVMPLTGQTAIAYDLGLTYLDTDGGSATTVGAGFTYYFNRAFGAGLDVDFTNGDDFDQSSFTLSADWFVTPAAHVGVAYNTLGQDADGDSILLVGGLRF